MSDQSNSILNQAILAGDKSLSVNEISPNRELELADSLGRPPLLNAAIEGQIEVVRALLLKKKINVNASDPAGWTAIHFAAQNNDLELIKILVRQGAEVNRVDENGNSPLWVAETRPTGSREIQSFLERHDADPDHKNQFGVSPRDLRN